MPFDFLANGLATLFVTIDPPGLAPIFLVLTVGMDPAQRRAAAVRAVVTAAAVLVAFALAGEGLLGLLGISLSAFRIAGGLMLFWIGFEMVFQLREQRKTQAAEQAVSDDHVRNIATVPLAVPLMAGPGAITATILLAGQDVPGYWAPGLVIAMVALVLACCLAVFMLAGRIDSMLGQTGRTILSRLLGVILAALAVQFVADGARAIWS